MSTPKKKLKTVKLSKIERAILLLADYMEDPMHDEYKIKMQVLDILGYEFTPLTKKK